ncbi:MAG: exosortase/archaeosortase family protein [Verrucomicrobiota bacterium]
MPVSAERLDPPAAQMPSSGNSSGLWLAAIALLVLWSELVLQLRLDWSLNPSYSYGWTVPFLALFLLVRRWASRPEPKPARSFLPVAFALIAAVLLPLRTIAKANPDWRLVSWALALTLVFISLCLFWRSGGLPWLKHFAFPILFLLVSVPWPTQFEQTIVQQLMRLVAAIDVELLNLFGVTALLHGNVIELANGFLGVEDACSGIRSLQSTLMLSLFLGEFYALTVRKRVLLVLAGGVLAFFFNLVRTFLLAWVGAQKGTASIASWHDPAGFGVLFACLLSLWAISLWMTKTAAAIGSANIAATVPLFPNKVLIALIVWIAVVELGSEAWFRVNAGREPMAPEWTVTWPPRDQFQELPIPDQAAELLRYNEGRSIAWNDDAGKHWNLFFFKWLPGRTAALFVSVHRPDICLPAAGLVAVGSPKSELLRIGNLALPIRSYRFDQSGVPLHVYFCYWDGTLFQSEQQMIDEDWTFMGRMRRTWFAKRDRGTQTLEVAVWGYDDAMAGQELKRTIARFVKS